MFVIMKSMFFITVIAVSIVAAHNEPVAHWYDSFDDKKDTVTVVANDTIVSRPMEECDLWIETDSATVEQSNFVSCSNSRCKSKCNGAHYKCAHCMCSRR